jgi:hypothetical protein
LQIFLFFADLLLLFVCSRRQKYLHSTELYPKNDGGGPIVSKKEKEKKIKNQEKKPLVAYCTMVGVASSS